MTSCSVRKINLLVNPTVRFHADKCCLTNTRDSGEVHFGERIEVPERH